ncbi:hypothetical protein P2G70_05935, partial [Mannheimia haemolytica]|nr:hypothetical protein [Mannheimia haemolytica]
KYENLTYYNNYGYPIQKATKFKSNINLNLKSEKKKGNKQWGSFSKKYNERSNIPIDLILDIYKSAKLALKKEIVTHCNLKLF